MEFHVSAMQRGETLRTKTLAPMHKTYIICAVLSASGVNHFSPYGYKAFSVLMGDGLCSTVVCRLTVR